MRLADLMSTDVKKASPSDSADLAWERMRTHGIHHLAVVDGGRVVGLVSERDLGGARGGGMRLGKAVADVMSDKVIVAAPTTTVRQAANLLRGHAIGSLLVVEGEKLRGIVTVSDLLALLGRGVDRPVERGKRWTLKHRGPRRRPASRVAT
jgi:acetoin utilization protein AcuB